MNKLIIGLISSVVLVGCGKGVDGYAEQQKPITQNIEPSSNKVNMSITKLCVDGKEFLVAQHTHEPTRTLSIVQVMQSGVHGANPKRCTE